MPPEATDPKPHKKGRGQHQPKGTPKCPKRSCYRCGACGDDYHPANRCTVPLVPGTPVKRRMSRKCMRPMPSPPSPVPNKSLVCSYCWNLRKSHTDYSTHLVREADGSTNCPELQKIVCRQCGATGKRAHVAYFCPTLRQASPTPLNRIANAFRSNFLPVNNAKRPGSSRAGDEANDSSHRWFDDVIAGRRPCSFALRSQADKAESKQRDAFADAYDPYPPPHYTHMYPVPSHFNSCPPPFLDFAPFSPAFAPQPPTFVMPVVPLYGEARGALFPNELREPNADLFAAYHRH